MIRRKLCKCQSRDLTDLMKTGGKLFHRLLSLLDMMLSMVLPEYGYSEALEEEKGVGN